MTVLLFKPRFVAPIREGRKRQTIRPDRHRPVRPGDVLSLRYWSGSPYRSPQAEIVPPVVCAGVDPVRIEADAWENTIGVEVAGVTLTRDEVRAFVRADGFRCVSDMAGYYRDNGTETFDGILIRWEVSPC